MGFGVEELSFWDSKVGHKSGFRTRVENNEPKKVRKSLQLVSKMYMTPFSSEKKIDYFV